MTEELPVSKSDYRKSKRYARALAAEKRNPYYKFHKASPDSYPLNVGCCAVRAICTAENISFETAEKLLLDHLSKIGYGMYAYCSQDYLTSKYPKYNFGTVKGEKRMTAGEFAKLHPVGRYVLHTAKHLVACVNGKIMDTFDSTKMCVYNCWTVKSE